MIILIAIFAVFAGLVLAFAALIAVTNRLSEPADARVAKDRGDALLATTGSTVVAVVAHPDDVDWYTGGTLSALHRNGNRVVVVVGTSGEKGGNGPDLGERREDEQRRAGRILGYDEIIFLRLPDRGLEPDGDFRRRLKDIFERSQPKYVFSFDPVLEGYIYRHPDHEAAGRVAVQVAPDFPSIKRLYLFHTRQPDTLVDIGSLLGPKGRALEQHRSQREGPRWFVRLVPRVVARGFSRGFARPFPEVGVEAGELFRSVAPRR